MSYSPQGDYILIHEYEGSTLIYETFSKEEVHCLEFYSQDLLVKCSFSNDGRYIMKVTYQGII